MVTEAENALPASTMTVTTSAAGSSNGISDAGTDTMAGAYQVGERYSGATWAIESSTSTNFTDHRESSCASARSIARGSFADRGGHLDEAVVEDRLADRCAHPTATCDRPPALRVRSSPSRRSCGRSVGREDIALAGIIVVSRSLRARTSLPVPSRPRGEQQRASSTSSPSERS